MLLTCGWAAEVLERQAPLELALEYDNSGLILGSRNKPLKTVLVALDLTDSVADEAVECAADLVLTHHPLIFTAVKRITDEDSLGRRIMKLLRHDISVYAAHTNLDMSAGGTNDVLAQLLELHSCAPLEAVGESAALGRVGELPSEFSLGELVETVKTRLGLSVVGVIGAVEQKVRRVGICTGSGAKLVAKAKARGCDVYITGDVTYHNAQAAEELGIAMIDATHYGTEVVVVKALKRLLETRAAEAGAELTVLESKADVQTIKYM